MAHIYNNIPLIEEAAVPVSTLQAFVVPQLKMLLNQYHLESDFGIVLVHRHFDLKSAEEQVVDLNGPGTLVSSVFSHGRPDSQVVHDYNLDMPSPFAIVPSKFLVRDELVPYEYKCVPKDDENLYISRTKRLPQKFLKDWYVILGSYRAQDKLGVVDLLTEKEIDGFEWTDTTRLHPRIIFRLYGSREKIRKLAANVYAGDDDQKNIHAFGSVTSVGNV